MNRWSRIVLAIALVASVGWVVAGVAGGRAGRDPQSLALHMLIAFAATLLWLLAAAWIVVFVAGCERASRRLARGDVPALGTLARDRRRITALGAASMALALGQFGASGMLFPGRLPATLHFAIALLALGAQLAFVVTAARIFSALQVRMEECAAAGAEAA